MIITTPNITRNYLFLKKGGFKICDLDLILKEKIKFPFKSLVISRNTSKDTKINDKGQIQKQYLTSTTFIKNKDSKNAKMENYKKKLFRKNILSSEKNYLLEDYMRKKELDLINFHNKKKISDIRKTFFSEEKADEDRYSYIKRDKFFNRKNKFTLMVKDIESNFILLKDKRNRKIKDFLLKEKLESEKTKFQNFNDKLGVKSVFLKTEKIFNKHKTFSKKNVDFIKTVNNYFNTFNATENGSFNQNKRRYVIK
jgi:hypothetical protein